MSTSQPDAAGGSASAAWDLNACDELSANIPGGDSALQSRMQTLLQQVDVAAKSQTNGINYFATNKPSLEQLASTNRTQSAHLQALSQEAAQREVLIGQLQVQIATARLQFDHAREQSRADLEQLAVHHSQMLAQAQEQLQQQQPSLQHELQRKLAQAAQNQAAQQAQLVRLCTLADRARRWLEHSTEYLGVHHLEIPSECDSALSLLNASTSLTASVLADPNGRPSPGETGVGMPLIQSVPTMPGQSVPAMPAQPGMPAQPRPGELATGAEVPMVHAAAYPNAVGMHET